MTNFVQNISETISFAESRSSTIGKKPSETFSISEVRKGAARSVLSDIKIAQGDITQEGFATMLASGSAVGYSDFRNFIAGDHEYEKAIFKGIIGAEDASLPRILTLSVDVDVPDVFDRGTVTITQTSSATTVAANRAFYSVQDVVATAKNGSVVAVPRVSNIRTTGGVTYFDIELVDVGGARVTGEASWALRGY